MMHYGAKYTSFVKRLLGMVHVGCANIALRFTISRQGYFLKKKVNLSGEWLREIIPAFIWEHSVYFLYSRLVSLPRLMLKWLFTERCADRKRDDIQQWEFDRKPIGAKTLCKIAWSLAQHCTFLGCTTVKNTCFRCERYQDNILDWSFVVFIFIVAKNVEGIMIISSCNRVIRTDSLETSTPT